jgi:hypothetical protein
MQFVAWQTEAEAMIRSLKGFPLLDGARGKPKADVKALAGALAARRGSAMRILCRGRGESAKPSPARRGRKKS